MRDPRAAPLVALRRARNPLEKLAMNYIWEVMLKALEQGLEKEKLRFVPEMNGSPYFEASFEELNADTLWEKEIKINPLYRFSNIFAHVFGLDLTRYQALRELLFDVFMHYQGQLDLRQGLTKSEFYIRAMLKDILSGEFGSKLAEDAFLFTNFEMKSILHGFLTLNRTGISLELFKKIMRTVYPRALMYRNNNIYREILVYLPDEKNDSDLRKLDFLVSMFLDVNYTVYIFWKHHFGIIGVDETLEYGDMLIF